MHLKAFLSALILTVLPMMALAKPEGCSGHGSQQAMTCLDGWIWDDAMSACVPLVITS